MKIIILTFILSTHIFAMEIKEIDEQDELGYSQLMRAALYGELKKAQKLIFAGAKLDLQNHDGETALMLATAYQTNSGIAHLLINAKANVCIIANNGRTALHRAAGRNLSIVKALLEAGADPLARDNQGNTPKMRALAYMEENRHNDRELIDTIKLLHKFEPTNSFWNNCIIS